VVGSCEHCIEPPGSIKDVEFLDYLSVLFIFSGRTLVHRVIIQFNSVPFIRVYANSKEPITGKH
jgi:hypothetical protein